MKGHRYKKKGWFGESRRHYLAAKGISTNRKYKQAKTGPGRFVESIFESADPAKRARGAISESERRGKIAEKAIRARPLTEEEKELKKELRKELGGSSGSGAVAWQKFSRLVKSNRSEAVLLINSFIREREKMISSENVSSQVDERKISAFKEDIENAKGLRNSILQGSNVVRKKYQSVAGKIWKEQGQFKEDSEVSDSKEEEVDMTSKTSNVQTQLQGVEI